MGVDHHTEGTLGATVTPIRPEIQLGDTTPFGITPPGPTPPSTEDEDTWGSSPRRRMQAGEPTDHPVRLTANDPQPRGRRCYGRRANRALCRWPSRR